MKNYLITTILWFNILFSYSMAQEPLSFFPHAVGDRWQIYDNWGNLITNQTIIEDSIGPDGSHNLFYDSLSTNYGQYRFRIDTALNVFDNPQSPNWNYLLYKLDADIGEVWENPISGELRFAWVAKIETAYVFSQLTTIKIFRYGPGRPDSANTPGLLENWLASGFGLIYSEFDLGFFYLQGCIIAGDTSGILTSAENIVSEIPIAFELKQNYPNPFNPSTTIEYELQHEAEVNISVYDILGQQIAILYDGLKPAGNFEIQWNASGFASGIYICRLKANEKTHLIKMLLSK